MNDNTKTNVYFFIQKRRGSGWLDFYSVADLQCGIDSMIAYAKSGTSTQYRLIKRTVQTTEKEIAC